MDSRIRRARSIMIKDMRITQPRRKSNVPRWHHVYRIKAKATSSAIESACIIKMVVGDLYRSIRWRSSILDRIKKFITQYRVNQISWNFENMFKKIHGIANIYSKNFNHYSHSYGVVCKMLYLPNIFGKIFSESNFEIKYKKYTFW